MDVVTRLDGLSDRSTLLFEFVLSVYMQNRRLHIFYTFICIKIIDIFFFFFFLTIKLFLKNTFDPYRFLFIDDL